MSFEFTGAFGLPSVQGALETTENVFWWGRFEQEAFIGSLIDGSTVDAGNAGYTDVLRPGLLLGKVTVGGKLKQWNPAASDGTEKIFGILGYAQKLTRLGAAADRWLGWIYTWGFLKAERILVPGATNYGISELSGGVNYEHLVRAQLHNRFHFNDQLEGNNFGGYRTVAARTATEVAVTDADHDTLFTNTGASGNVNFTLAAGDHLKSGLRYGFYGTAGGNLTVTSGTVDVMVTHNDATASTVAMSAAGHKVGGMIEIYSDGAKWLVVHQGNGTLTVT